MAACPAIVTPPPPPVVPRFLVGPLDVADPRLSDGGAPHRRRTEREGSPEFPYSEPGASPDGEARGLAAARLAGPRTSTEGDQIAMRIYVGNLDYAATSEDVRGLFAGHGEVSWAEVQTKARTGQSRGFALVDMPNDSEAQAAIAALNGSDYRGRPLTVNESRPRRTVRDLYATGNWYGR